jgi:signal transduction histidine kinase
LHDNSYTFIAEHVEILRDEFGTAQRMLGALHDINDRRRLEHDVARATEDERNRFGRELHDTLAQQIAAIDMLSTTVAAKSGEFPVLTSTVSKLCGATAEAKRQLYRLSRGHFPIELEIGNLSVALATLARDTEDIYQVDCAFEGVGGVQIDDNFAATQLYLIAREAVFNAIRHAGASRVLIALDTADQLYVHVSDNGIGGVDANRNVYEGRGLRIMRYRCELIGGTFTIDSPPGHGTSVSCTVRRRGHAS